MDRSLAEQVGVEYTGRVVSFIAISGHVAKAHEAVVHELEVEGEALRYEPVAVAEIPGKVKETLRGEWC